MKGFSQRNLKYMRRFAEIYPNFSIVQAPLAQITWYHNITLLSKLKTEEQRLWYAQKTVENGWSRNVMVHQIEIDLYERQGKAINNFDKILPTDQSDLAKETFKSSYIFDFLTLSDKIKERVLEPLLLSDVTQFLLELGNQVCRQQNKLKIVLDVWEKRSE